MNDIAYPYIEVEPSQTPSLPISLSDIKSYLKLSENNVAVNSELSMMCETALAYAEKYSRRIFRPKKFITNRCFWGELRNGVMFNMFSLRRSPVTSIESIKYDDDNVLSTDKYKLVRNTAGYDKVNLIGDMPECKNEWFPIEITFVAGYTTLPQDIKLAMLQHIASMWMNRGDCDNDTYNKCPKISKDIYKKYKIMEVGV